MSNKFNELGATTLKSFLEQFGQKDEHSLVFLEVLLEELTNAKIISLSGQPQQEGHQDNNDITRGSNSEQTD